MYLKIVTNLLLLFDFHFLFAHQHTLIEAVKKGICMYYYIPSSLGKNWILPVSGEVSPLSEAEAFFCP